MKSAHSARLTRPTHIGRIMNRLASASLTMMLMHTTPMMKAGTAVLTARARRTYVRWRSLARSALDRSSIVGGWWIVGRKAGLTAEMVARMWRIVKSGGRAVYLIFM